MNRTLLAVTTVIASTAALAAILTIPGGCAGPVLYQGAGSGDSGRDAGGHDAMLDVSDTDSGHVPHFGEDSGDEAGPECVSGTLDCTTSNETESCVSGKWVVGAACSGTHSSCCFGTCVDEQTDTSHCGACRHACIAGPKPECTVGVCSYALFSEGAYYLALDSTSVYFTQSLGSVYKGPLGGGTAAKLHGPGGPFGIAVDSTSVYWADLYNGVIKVSLDGGATATLAGAMGGPFGLAIDSTSVYWVTQGAFDSQNAALMKVPLDGGTTTTLFSKGSFLWAVAVDVTSVYWTNAPCAVGPPCEIGTGAVMKVPLGGGTVTTLAAGQNPQGIAVDSTSVYWADNDMGVVMKVPLDGGTATTLSSGGSPWGVAVDSSNVYWTSGGPGTVMKVPLGGGTATTIYSGAGAYNIAVDSTSVYWTDMTTVRRAPK